MVGSCGDTPGSLCVLGATASRAVCTFSGRTSTSVATVSSSAPHHTRNRRSANLIEKSPRLELRRTWGEVPLWSAHDKLRFAESKKGRSTIQGPQSPDLSFSNPACAADQSQIQQSMCGEFLASRNRCRSTPMLAFGTGALSGRALGG